MRMNRGLLMTISLQFQQDLTKVNSEGEGVILAAIEDALFIVQRDGLMRDEPEVDMPVPTGRQLLASTPSTPIKGLRGLSERYRPYIKQAAPVDVLGMDFVSVSEFDVPHRPEQGVVHMFMFWSRELFTPQWRIKDETVLETVPDAVERLSSMIDKVADHSVPKSELEAALPYGIKMQKIRWLYRDADGFKSGINAEIPEDGACLRADGVAAMGHFFQTEEMREAVDGNDWLLVAPGQAVLVTRSQERLDDSVPGMKCSNVSGKIMRDLGIPEDPM
ncbi:MAG: hypothetical protein R3E76_14840 [Planctomycetota bacterium]